MGAVYAANPNSYYDCFFKPNEQPPAFVTVNMIGQGSPAWNEYYYGADAGGVVVNTYSHAGDQSLHLNG